MQATDPGQLMCCTPTLALEGEEALLDAMDKAAMRDFQEFGGETVFRLEESLDDYDCRLRDCVLHRWPPFVLAVMLRNPCFVAKVV
jgi:hypothetical protein